MVIRSGHRESLLNLGEAVCISHSKNTLNKAIKKRRPDEAISKKGHRNLFIATHKRKGKHWIKAFQPCLKIDFVLNPAFAASLVIIYKCPTLQLKI